MKLHLKQLPADAMKTEVFGFVHDFARVDSVRYLGSYDDGTQWLVSLSEEADNPPVEEIVSTLEKRGFRGQHISVFATP